MADVISRRLALAGLAAAGPAAAALANSETGSKVTGDTGMSDKDKQAAATEAMARQFAPKLAEVTDHLLFADVWERPELSKRDRSLITVAALIAMDNADALRFHLALAVKNGVKKEQLAEVITHLAFYAGWPKAWSALGAANEALAKA